MRLVIHIGGVLVAAVIAMTLTVPAPAFGERLCDPIALRLPACTGRFLVHDVCRPVAGFGSLRRRPQLALIVSCHLPPIERLYKMCGRGSRQAIGAQRAIERAPNVQQSFNQMIDQAVEMEWCRSNAKPLRTSGHRRTVDRL